MIPVLRLLAACDHPSSVHSRPPAEAEPTLEVPAPDTGADPWADCLVVDLGPGGAATLDAGDARLDVPVGGFAEEVRVALCREGPPNGFAALSDGWTVVVEPETAPREPMQLAIRTATSTPAAALFVPGPDGAAVRSLTSTWDPQEGYETPLWRHGTSFVATDERLVVPFEPRPTALDLLVVLDNTCSMLDEQDKLTRLLPDVLVAIDRHAVDYRLGVITTDDLDPAHQGQLVEAGGRWWVDPATPDRGDVLAALLAVGTDGVPPGQGLATLTTALELTGYYDYYSVAQPVEPTLLRPDAALVVAVVSIGDDGSAEVPAEVAYALLGLQRPLLAFHSLVPTAGADRGDRYIEVSHAVGGRVVEIDGGDWVRFLDDLGDDVLLHSGMPVPLTPDGGVPELWVVPANGAEPRPCPETAYDPVAGTLACLADDEVPADAALWVLTAPARKP